MVKSKFKAGDRVRVVSNDIQPQFISKTGIVKKAYCTFCESDTTGNTLWFYRIEVNGETLRGIAADTDIELCD